MNEEDRLKLSQLHVAVFGNGKPENSLIVQVRGLRSQVIFLRQAAYAIGGLLGAIWITLLTERLNG